MPNNGLTLFVGGGRALFGAVAYASPTLLAERGGLPGVGASPDARYMTRLFGARDLVVGALTLLPRSRSTALKIGVVFDVFDTVSGILAGSDGMPASRSRLVAGAAGAFAVAGAVEVVRQRG